MALSRFRGENAVQIERYRKTRYWTVLDATGTLVCLCVYRKGAEEVVRRLQALDDTQQWQEATGPADDIVGDVVA
jgi:hypothetical protein